MDLEQATPETRPPQAPESPRASSELEAALEANEDAGFEPLEPPAPTEPEGVKPEAAPAPAAPKVIPFTGGEIAGFVGTVVGMVVAGREGWTPDQAAAFNAVYSSGKIGAVLPIPLAQGLALPPAEVMEKLRVGEALAMFGIGKPKSLNIESAADLPPLMRIGVGALMLGAAAFGGVLAARSSKPETTPAPDLDADRPDAGRAARAQGFREAP
jgi:hypothetical protein